MVLVAVEEALIAAAVVAVITIAVSLVAAATMVVAIVAVVAVAPTAVVADPHFRPTFYLIQKSLKQLRLAQTVR